MLNHTPGISSWERARSSSAPLTRNGSRALPQVIAHGSTGRGGAVHGGDEPLVNIYRWGGGAQSWVRHSPTSPSHTLTLPAC